MSRPSRRPTSSRRVPAGCSFVFGLLLLLAGLGLAGFVGTRMLPRVLEVSRWEPTPCEVHRWEVKVTPDPAKTYRVEVDLMYAYEFAGRRYEGTTYDALDTLFPEINDAEEAGARARTGPAHCYVNPAQPEESSFRPATFWLVGGLMGGGGLLALAGAGLTLAALVKLGRKLAAGGEAARAKPGCLGRLVLPVVGVLFLGAGFLVWKLALRDRPDWDTIAARMVETPGRLIASGVEVKTSRRSGSSPGKKRSYHAKVAFQYDHGGRTWHSGWLDFNRGRVSGSEGRARAVVERYPAGQAVTCWVDPEAPWRAVLEKEEASRWWWWIFPVVFGGVGLAGLGWGMLRLLRGR